MRWHEQGQRGRLLPFLQARSFLQLHWWVSAMFLNDWPIIIIPTSMTKWNSLILIPHLSSVSYGPHTLRNRSEKQSTTERQTLLSSETHVLIDNGSDKWHVLPYRHWFSSHRLPKIASDIIFHRISSLKEENMESWGDYSVSGVILVSRGSFLRKNDLTLILCDSPVPHPIVHVQPLAGNLPAASILASDPNCTISGICNTGQITGQSVLRKQTSFSHLYWVLWEMCFPRPSQGV